uniref:Uncharacterized protein n=1 Tax=Ditylum brightwellii TaxID=49249 RepID=A0A7S4QSG9_9STRA
MQLELSPSNKINFREDPSRQVGDEGWICFDVNHADDGVHALYMSYASPHSCPCRIRIGDKEMNIGIACGRTGTSNAPREFDEGLFDLNEGPVTRVAFLAQRENEWPLIESFRFIPEDEVVKDELTEKAKKRIDKSLWHDSKAIIQTVVSSVRDLNTFDDDNEENCRDTGTTRRSFIHIDSKENAMPWHTAPTAVTFSFEIGIPCEEGWGEDDIEIVRAYLRGKAIKFTFDASHDSITIDGDPIGSREKGINWPIVSFYKKSDVIESVTLGLSSHRGEGTFNSLVLKKGCSKRHGHIEKRVLVGSHFDGPTYTFDRKRLGLDLWLTSIYAPKNSPITRYGFTLSSDSMSEFDPKEFELFWEWFIQMKHQMVINRDKQDQNNEEQQLIKEDYVRTKMSDLHDFLLSSFSCSPAIPSSIEGYLYGTSNHVNIVFDVFSVCIYRLPDGKSFQSILFVDGVQHNPDKSSVGELVLERNDILGFAINLALQDNDLLHQMGLAIPTQTENQFLDERELLPLRKDSLFRGNYENTPMARRIICILAMAGLRKITYETITNNESDEWDIYCLAAARRQLFGPKSIWWYYQLNFAALFTVLLQVLAPIFIIYRAFEEGKEVLTIDVYIVQILFCVYAIFYEVRSWDVDNSDKLVAWLCFLPEFSTKKLLFGMAINKLTKIVVSASIIIIIQHSFTVLDVTLNALAMYFILDVDNLLVNPAALEKIQKYSRNDFFTIKAKTAITYSQPMFSETELPLIKDLPSHYLAMASTNVSSFCVAFLIGGTLWLAIEPHLSGHFVPIF